MMRTKEGMNMYKLQEQIRNNTNDISGNVNDLMNWSKIQNEAEKKGTKKAPAQPTKAVKMPPIRNKIDITNSIKLAQA